MPDLAVANAAPNEQSLSGTICKSAVWTETQLLFVELVKSYREPIANVSAAIRKTAVWIDVQLAFVDLDGG